MPVSLKNTAKAILASYVNRRVKAPLSEADLETFHEDWLPEAAAAIRAVIEGLLIPGPINAATEAYNERLSAELHRLGLNE